jgi:dihydrofolate reductase
MGRVTWESLPERFRPLPDRVNVVVSRSATYSANGAVVVASVGDALAIEPQLPRWSIGGAEIYAATIGLADRLEQTVVRLDVDGDRVAPRISDAWERVAADPAEGWNTAENGLDYRFASFRRRDRDSSAS